jgi:hypothetical protein
MASPYGVFAGAGLAGTGRFFTRTASCGETFSQQPEPPSRFFSG